MGHRLVLVLLVIVALIAPAGRAQEQVPIASILAHAMSYQLHTVTLRGIAQEVTLLPLAFLGAVPYECVRKESYMFWLADETGKIQVLMPGPCGALLAPQRVEPVAEGARVEVVAHVMVHAFQGGADVRPPVQAWGLEIRTIDDDR